jgi:hypothetical protein
MGEDWRIVMMSPFGTPATHRETVSSRRNAPSWTSESTTPVV